jgi:hypothetical protein
MFLVDGAIVDGKNLCKPNIWNIGVVCIVFHQIFLQLSENILHIW